jgi:hypothetical protein
LLFEQLAQLPPGGVGTVEDHNAAHDIRLERALRSQHLRTVKRRRRHQRRVDISLTAMLTLDGPPP